MEFAKDEICKTCPFWVPLVMADGGHDVHLGLGECHENAPKCTQVDGPLDFAGHWPETEWNQFCGRHPGYRRRMKIEAYNAQ